MKTIRIVTRAGVCFARAYGSVSALTVARDPGSRELVVVHLASGRALVSGLVRLDQAKEVRALLMRAMPADTWERSFDELGQSAALRMVVEEIARQVKEEPKPAREAECLCAEIDPSDRPCLVCEANSYLARDLVARTAPRNVERFVTLTASEPSVYPVPTGQGEVMSGPGGPLYRPVKS